LKKRTAISVLFKVNILVLPFLAEATMIMAQAHMAHEEYLLAEHFLDEYIRRYATPEGREYAEFLKSKPNFWPFPIRDVIKV
jgi:outer membrane protein assembly factor BamD (BamD/ComL family)